MNGRTLVAVLAILGLGAAMATALPAASRTKRCKASQVRTKVTILKTKGHPRRRATLCLPRTVKRPASAAAGLRRARTIALRQVPKRVKRLLRRKPARRVQAAARAVDRALLGAFRPTAQAAAVTRDSDTQVVPGPRGTRTVQRREGTNWDDAEPNPGVEIEVSTDTTATRIGAVGSSRSTRAKMTRTMARCPDEGGVGRGVLRYSNSERQVVDKPGGGQAVFEVKAEFDARVLVHFNDEAAVSSVEVTGDWKWSSETRLSGRQLSIYSVGGGVSGSPTTGGQLSSFTVSVANATSPFAAVVGQLLGVITAEVPRPFVSELVSGIARRASRGVCARLVPDPATVRVDPGKTVPITTGLVDFDGAPLPGKVKAAAAQGSVTPEAQAEPIARFTYTALGSAPPGKTDTVTLTHVSKRGRAFEKSVTVIYNDPPLPNAYGGTISGTWDSASTGEHWTYSGTVELAYSGRDEPFPPHGAPPGRYRRFTLTSGSANVSVTANSPFGCGFEGSGVVTITPGEQTGALSVQTTSAPAYMFGLGNRDKTITVTRTGGEDCNPGTTTQYPVPGIWTATRSAHTSGSATAIAGEETIATPETPFDYDTFSRWNLTAR